MGLLWLGVLAVGPGMCLAHVLWARDREREPLGNLAAYLLLGCVAVIPAAMVEGGLLALLPDGPRGLSVLWLPVWVFFGIALVEEAAKRLLLLARARRDRHIEEPFDWLVYAVAVALGFATLENVFYVYESGAGTGVLRAFTAVPAHGLDGTMMGWRLARAARLQGAPARRERRLALLEPTAWHAAYDLPLLALETPAFAELAVLLLPAWLAVLLAQWRVCVARIRGLMREQRHAAPPLLLADELVRRLRGRRPADPPAAP
jgi:RsiW-degrading membrane proteinase PrsW (M82 family)